VPLSAARLLLLGAALGDEESLEKEELQVARGDDEEAEEERPPGDVLRVGQQQEEVCTLPHAAEVVVAEHVEDVVLQFVSRTLQQILLLSLKLQKLSLMLGYKRTTARSHDFTSPPLS